MKILEILTPSRATGLQGNGLASTLGLLADSRARPLLADDELQLALLVASISDDPAYSPSILVRDFIHGLSAKLAVAMSD